MDATVLQKKLFYKMLVCVLIVLGVLRAESLVMSLALLYRQLA